MVAYFVPILASYNSPITIGSIGTVYTNSSDLSSYTATGLPTVATDEVAIIAIAGRAASTRTITAVTINGEACSVLHKADNDGSTVALYIGPLGVSGDVAVTLSGSWLRTAIGLWPCKNIRSATATDTADSIADPMNASIDCLPGGGIFGVAFNSDNSTFTWTNLTESFDVTPESNTQASGAANVFQSGVTARNITADASTTNDRAVMVLASVR